MKLHLPKMLLIAVMTACSYVQAAMTTPTQGINKYTYVNGDWVKDANNTNTSDDPCRDTAPETDRGAFMVISEDFDAIDESYGDTSDVDGGVWVEDNVRVTNFNLGRWGGSVYVGAGASLSAFLQSHNAGGCSIKSGGAENRANIWVDGSFTLSGLKFFDGGGNDHYWHIGTNGKITLSGTDSITKQEGKKWHIEVVENNFRTATEAERTATLTNRSTTQTTHKFLEAAADLSSLIDSVTIILGDGTECTAASLSGTGGQHTATVNNAIKLTTLTWAGTADNDTWTNTGSNWEDSEGAATSFLNGDSVIFGAAAEGISSTVNVGSSVTVNNMAVNGSYTLNIADSASLAVQGELNIASALEVTNNGTLTFNNGITVAEDSTVTFSGSGTTTLNGAVNISENATLELSSTNAATNGSLLGKATGEGNVTITTNTTLSGTATQAGGILTIGDGGSNEIKLDANNSSIASFSQVSLNHGKLDINIATPVINDLTITENGGSLYIDDMTKGKLGTIATTTLNGDLAVGGNWKFNLQFKKITGTGDIKITNKTNTAWNDPSDVAILATENYSGIISYNRENATGTGNNSGDKANATCTLRIGTDSGSVSMGGLQLLGTSGIGGVTGSVTSATDSQSSLGALKLTHGSTLTLSGGNFAVDSLTVEGTGNRLSIGAGSALQLENSENTEIAGGVSISGAGSFEKKGAGTLTLSCDNTGLTGGITVSGGTLAITTANALGGGSVSLADGTILDATAVQMSDAFKTVVNKTSGEGLVKFTGGDFTSNQGDAAFGRVSVSENITVAADVQVNGDLAINSWSQSGAVVNTTVNKALTVDGELRLESQATLVLDQADSAVSASTITLGHHTGNNAGHISLRAGSLTTGSINLTVGTNTGSTLTMTGGELSINQEGGAIAAGAQVKISGGTLKAADASWTLNLDAADSIGNVTFDLAAGKSISLEGETLVATGALTLSGSGTLNFNVDSIIMSEAVLGSLRAESDSVDADKNGFSTLNYYFVEGLGNGATLDGAEDKITVTVGGSKYEFTTSTGAISGTEEVFIINTSFDTSGAATLEKDVTYFHVNQGGEFTLEGDIVGGKTLREIINTSHGGGTLKLATDYTVTDQDAFSQFGGTVKVDGSTLEFKPESDTALDVQILAGIELVNNGVLKVAWGISLHAGSIIMNDGTSIEVANGGLGHEMTADIVVAGNATLKGGSTGENTIVDGTISGTGTLNISNLHDNSWQIASDISGNLALNIDSVAKDKKYLYITGNNTFSGGTTLTGGVLHTGSTTALGTGLVTITDASTLRAVESLNLQSGISAERATVEVADSKTLFLGASSSIGTLNAAQGTISLGSGVELSLGGATHAIGTLSTAGANTINLAAGSTLNAFTKVGDGTITLTGSGAYDLGSGIASLDTGVSLGANWAGTVTLSGITSANGLDLNKFGNASSTVKLNGVKGWFDRTYETGADKDKSVKTHIILAEGGITFDNYSTSGNYAFNKGISGTGNFVIDAKNDDVNASPTILIGANSTGTWSGAFQVNDNKDSNYVQLFLNGNGTYFDSTKVTSGVEMNDAGGTLKVFVGYATPNATNVNNVADFTAPDQDSSSGTPYVTTVNGAIKNNSTGSLELTALNNAVFNKNVTVTSMTVKAGKTATMNATLKADTVNLADQATISGGTMSNVQMSSTGVSAASTANGAKGSITDADVEIAQLAQDASFTIQDMTLTNTTVTAATVNTKVNLSNVSTTGVQLAKGKFHMQGQLPVALVNAGGSAVEFSSSALSGLTLNTADSSASLVVDLGDLSCLTPMGPGQYDLTITLSGFTMENYSGLATGAGLVFAADSWLGSLLNQAQNANVQMTIAQAKAGAAAAAEGGSASGVSYSTGNVGTLTITISGLNVPEPTTATLSLLALAALAARRRRKA